MGSSPLAVLSFAALFTLLAFARAQNIPYFTNRTSINVCTSETTPMVFCTGREPQNYVGYEIALFDRVRQQLGWRDSMLNWNCMDWDAMVDDLASEEGVCDIAVAGLNVISDYIDRGIVFTWTTFRNGLSVMVTANKQKASYWAFMDSFSWEVWLAIVLTAIAVGLLVWLVEMWVGVAPTRKRGIKHSQLGASTGGLQHNVWLALGRPMQTGDMIGRSFASNLIILVFSFMVLILVTLYTANTAANITAVRLETTIQGLADLPGKAVGTWNTYVPDLQRRGVAAVGFPWDNKADERAMLEAVQSGLVRALVLDTSFLDYRTATICNASIVGSQFNLFDQAVAFPAGFDNQELLRRYNDILVSLRESGEMEDLIQKYVDPPPDPCKEQVVTEEGTKITFNHVAGLWLLLAASVGVALVLAALHQLLLWNARRVARTRWYARSRQQLSKLGSSGALGGLARSWSGGSRAGMGRDGEKGVDEELSPPALMASGAASSFRAANGMAGGSLGAAVLERSLAGEGSSTLEEGAAGMFPQGAAHDPTPGSWHAQMQRPPAGQGHSHANLCVGKRDSLGGGGGVQGEGDGEEGDGRLSIQHSMHSMLEELQCMQHDQHRMTQRITRMVGALQARSLPPPL